MCFKTLIKYNQTCVRYERRDIMYSGWRICDCLWLNCFSSVFYLCYELNVVLQWCWASANITAKLLFLIVGVKLKCRKTLKTTVLFLVWLNMLLINITGDSSKKTVAVCFAVLRAMSCPSAVICTSTLSKCARVRHQDAVKFKRKHPNVCSQIQCLS